jgi:DNA invertase Pin-like site-specific DNA recombinase
MAVNDGSIPHKPPQIRAALYARVSTNNGQNPEMQLEEMRQYCSRRGWQVCAERVDRGISGSLERRPELDRLLAACRKRQIDAVVVYRYDRFARSLRQLVNALEEFRRLGIDFVSLHEGVDTSSEVVEQRLRAGVLTHHGQQASEFGDRTRHQQELSLLITFIPSRSQAPIQ